MHSLVRVLACNFHQMDAAIIDDEKRVMVFLY